MFGLLEIVPSQKLTVASKADCQCISIRVWAVFSSVIRWLTRPVFRVARTALIFFLAAADQKNLVDPCEIIQRDANDNIIFAFDEVYHLG